MTKHHQRKTPEKRPFWAVQLPKLTFRCTIRAIDGRVARTVHPQENGV
jgi:hypothetical protein